MKIWYVAIDGTLFDNEDECASYEAEFNHSNLKNINFYSKIKDKYYPYSLNLKCIYDDGLYQDCDKIIIHNTNELADLLWLAEECGWCEFNEQISSPGTWIRHEEDGNGYWTLVKE